MKIADELFILIVAIAMLRARLSIAHLLEPEASHTRQMGTIGANLFVACYVIGFTLKPQKTNKSVTSPWR